MAHATHEPRGYSTQEANDANTQTWQVFKRKFNEQPMTYGVIFVLIGVLIGGFVFAYSPDWEADNLFSYLTNFATEGLSVLITVFVLDRFQERRTTEQFKKELIAQVRHGGPTMAQQALTVMRMYDEERGWYRGKNGILVKSFLVDAPLKGVDLAYANLQGVNLSIANLQGANLMYADLNEAHTDNANLKEANLKEANLKQIVSFMTNMEGANLCRANLEGAFLFESNLKNANLNGANMEGANLCRANLEGVTLDETIFSSSTVLPDAEIIGENEKGSVFNKFYDPDLGIEQMLRYTDSNQPDFWDPCVELANSEFGLPLYYYDDE